MKTRDFFFELPEELIAQYPTRGRGESRLMTVNRVTGAIEHHRVADLPDLLPPSTIAVFNDSRVRKARLFGRAEDTGGRMEFLLLKSRDGIKWTVMTKRKSRLRTGRVYIFPEDLRAAAENRGEEEILLHFSRPVTDDYLDRNGHVPLPPYIRRPDASLDAERYQTVYAKNTGSVASPTAGLHFTEEILSSLERKCITCVTVTLHVGTGTFLPVRSEDVEDHVMHEEDYIVDFRTSELLTQGKSALCPVLAVGTTSMRVLEAAWKEGRLPPGEGATRIFIYPGFRFKVVDMLFTNFHTPESTLLMLVSAFAGRDLIAEAYRAAIAERYRFFSYGDAMLIL